MSPNPPALQVITSGAFAAALKVLAPIYEKAQDETFNLHFGSSLGAAHDSIPTRLAQGQRLDAFILARQALDAFAAQGHLAAEPGWDLVASHIGMCVHRDSNVPDISSLEAFKQTLLASTRVALAASASGIYLSTEVFPQLELTEHMSRTAFTVYSERTGHVVARGEADLGFQQISEILPIEGVKLVGTLPPEIDKPFIFSAAIGAKCSDPERLKRVKSFLRFLASEQSAEVIRSAGLEPLCPDIDLS